MEVILESLQEKYRVIRDRFKKNFVVVGEGPGKSIPYTIRNNELFWFNWFPDGSYYKEIKDESIRRSSDLGKQQEYFYSQTGANWGVVMQVGDGVANMGFYFGMLATEYALMEKNASTNIAHKRQLADEIYYALEAMKRLDRKAFEIFGCQSDGYGGYFLRDDLDVDFYKSAPDTTQMLGRKIGGVKSDFLDPQKQHNFEDKINSEGVFMSHDQAIFLFLGLALLKKFLPANLKSKHSTEPLIDIVKKITRGIIERYKEYNWVVTAPNGKKNLKGGNSRAAGYAYPLALAGEYIFGEMLMDKAMIPFHRSWWGAGGQVSGIANNEQKMVEALRALSNYPLNSHSVASAFDPLLLLSPTLAMKKLFFINGINKSIDRNTNSNNLRSIYPLIQILLHSCPLKEDKKKKLKDHFTKILLDYPYFSCKEGRGKNIPNTKSVKGWKNGNRWVHNGVHELSREGEFDQATLYNGIEYMIAYNLYHLYFYENEPYYVASKRASDPSVRMKFSIRYDPSPPLHYPSFFDSTIPPKDHFHYCPHNDAIYYRGLDDVLYFSRCVKKSSPNEKDVWEWETNPIRAGYKLKCKAIFYQTERNKIYYVGTDHKWYNFFNINGNWHVDTIRKDINNATGDAVFDHQRSTIFYRGTDNTFNRLKWEPTGWVHTVIRPDVKTIAGELILGPGKVYYKNNEGRLFQMMPYNGAWHSWATTSSGMKIKDSLLYVQAPYNMFIYRGIDDNIHTIFFKNSKWNYEKLPHGNGNVANQIKYNPATKKIFYLGLDGKITAIFKLGNTWHYQKLENGPKVIGDFHISSNGNEVFFIGEDDRLYKHCLVGNWICRLVSQRTKNFTSIIALDKTEDRLYFYSLVERKVMFQY